MRALILAVGLVALPAMACSSNADTENETGVTREKACEDISKAICDQYSKCLPLFISLGFGDVATCVSRTKVGCPTGFDAPSTSSNPARVASCAAEIGKLTCEGLTQATPAVCIPEPGGLADGASCADDAQCKSTWCAKNEDASCGTCAVQPAVGAACVDLGKKNDGSTQKSCGRNLECAKDACAKPAPTGAACSDSQPCGIGLACFNSKCVAAGKPGSKCDPAGVTEPGCDLLQGSFCNQTTKVCQAFIYSKAGEPCSFSATEIKVCSAGSKCIGATATSPGTCVAPAADGAACNVTNGPDCLAPAKCRDGLCKLPSASACN
jgi:hypothetical protein